MDNFKKAETTASQNMKGLWAESACDGERKEVETIIINNIDSYKCSQKTYCTEMNSCEEARYHLETCGLNRLDSDGDGVPCETLCK